MRELLRQVQVNLAYRWFIGYQLDEPFPDHSTLSQALTRLGKAPEVVCADGAYGSESNAHEMEQRGVRLVAPPLRKRLRNTNLI